MIRKESEAERKVREVCEVLDGDNEEGFNFYDLRAPAQQLYPINTPFIKRSSK